MQPLLGLVSGFLFAVGLGISGMTRPTKVLGFLDVSGVWDPSLAFVMGGALVVYAIAWRIARPPRAPWLGGVYPSPPATILDARLLGGAAVFGVGWGLSGFCPGPALVSLATGMWESLVFCGAMALGMVVHRFADVRQGTTDEAQTGTT